MMVPCTVQFVVVRLRMRRGHVGAGLAAAFNIG